METWPVRAIEQEAPTSISGESMSQDYPEDLCMPLEKALIKIDKLRRGEGVKDDE